MRIYLPSRRVSSCLVGLAPADALRRLGRVVVIASAWLGQKHSERKARGAPLSSRLCGCCPHRGGRDGASEQRWWAGGLVGAMCSITWSSHAEPSARRQRSPTPTSSSERAGSQGSWPWSQRPRSRSMGRRGRSCRSASAGDRGQAMQAQHRGSPRFSAPGALRLASSPPTATPDRRSASYRTKLCFPFHWTDLVSALHVFAATGLSADETNLAATLMWLRRHQRSDGCWTSGLQKRAEPRC